VCVFVLFLVCHEDNITIVIEVDFYDSGSRCGLRNEKVMEWRLGPTLQKCLEFLRIVNTALELMLT